MSQVSNFNIDFVTLDTFTIQNQVISNFTKFVEELLLEADGICLKEICGKIDALYWRSVFYSRHVGLWLENPEYSRVQVRRLARFSSIRSIVTATNSCYDNYLNEICVQARRLMKQLYRHISLGNVYLKSLCIRTCINYSISLSNQLRDQIQMHTRMVRLHSQALFHLKGLRRLVGVNLIKENPDQYSDPDGSFWESYMEIFDNLHAAIMIERNECGPDDF